MTGNDLTFFRSWFSSYCGSFYSANEEDQRNIILKEEHTHNVSGNIRLIASGLPLGTEETMLAEIVALFHDIGRFRQYREYRTFRDAVSVNHAVLGTVILAEEGILARLSPRERRLVLHAVKFHNVYALPDTGDRDESLFLKLVRDADKLDIWRIFAEYYEQPREQRASAAGLDLPEVPGYSREVLSDFFAKRVVSHSSLRTLDDFKLLQLSWIYDINFRASLGLLLERGFIDRITATLPRTDEVPKIQAFLREYIQKRLEEGQP